AGRHPVHIGDLAATAPLQQGGGDPCLLLQRRVARILRPAMARRIQFPEDAPAALVRQVVEIIQGDVGETTRQLAPLRFGLVCFCRIAVLRQAALAHGCLEAHGSGGKSWVLPARSPPDRTLTWYSST